MKSNVCEDQQLCLRGPEVMPSLRVSCAAAYYRTVLDVTGPSTYTTFNLLGYYAVSSDTVLTAPGWHQNIKLVHCVRAW